MQRGANRPARWPPFSRSTHSSRDTARRGPGAPSPGVIPAAGRGPRAAVPALSAAAGGSAPAGGRRSRGAAGSEPAAFPSRPACQPCSPRLRLELSPIESNYARSGPSVQDPASFLLRQPGQARVASRTRRWGQQQASLNSRLRSGSGGEPVHGEEKEK